MASHNDFMLVKHLPWLKTTPKFTTFRVNTLNTSVDTFICRVKQVLEQLVQVRQRSGQIRPMPPVWQHPQIPELVVVGSWTNVEQDLQPQENEVIVDVFCGAAVLRGAHVFAPGVIGLTPGATAGEMVSVYADPLKVCKRGWTQKLCDVNRIFVGNGILQMGRKKLFAEEVSPRGVAVLMLNTTSGCPPLGSELCTGGVAVMQNLPSVVCGRVLDPQPGESVLDMCAAPGNKTTHLAMLMQNEGTLIALDKSASRMAKLKRTCSEFSVTNVQGFTFDSVKALKETNAQSKHSSLDGECCDNKDAKAFLVQGPPYPAETFDRILLDAPCSGLGQRPRLENIDAKQLGSFRPLQRKLLKAAVDLLKPGGTLVYSTCTILEAENEGIVRWAVDEFPSLQLVPAEPFLAPSPSPDFGSTILSPAEYCCVQKFNSSAELSLPVDVHSDTIGFFIARFKKTLKEK